MSLSGREFPQHILDEAEYLYDRSRGLTSEEFLRDHTLRRAFVRSVWGSGARPDAPVPQAQPGSSGTRASRSTGSPRERRAVRHK